VWAGPLWAVPRPAGQDPRRRPVSDEGTRGVRQRQRRGFRRHRSRRTLRCDDAHAETDAPPR